MIVSSAGVVSLQYWNFSPILHIYQARFSHGFTFQGVAGCVSWCGLPCHQSHRVACEHESNCTCSGAMFQGVGNSEFEEVYPTCKTLFLGGGEVIFRGVGTRLRDHEKVHWSLGKSDQPSICLLHFFRFKQESILSEAFNTYHGQLFQAKVNVSVSSPHLVKSVKRSSGLDLAFATMVGRSQISGNPAPNISALSDISVSKAE
jgi:hypothetical protein